MVVIVSTFPLLATGIALTWLEYKRRKSSNLKRKEKQKSLPKFKSGRVEKFYKGISKRQRPKISRNKEKLKKKKIETILEDNQVTLVTTFTNLKKTVNKIDVQEPVHNEEIVEDDIINSMVMTNFSGCHTDCHCNQADEQEPVQNECKNDVNFDVQEHVQNEEMEEDMITSMVMTNFNGCHNDCNCSQANTQIADSDLKKDVNEIDVQKPVQNDGIVEEDMIKSMVMTNFSGCLDDCNCSQACVQTADSKLVSSEDLAKLSEDGAKQPKPMWEENEGGDKSEDFETSYPYTSIKLKETSIFEESIIGNNKAGADFERFQSSTPITFPSEKRELVWKMQLSKIKTRKRPFSVEIPSELSKPSSTTNSGCENQISKEVEHDDLPIDLNMEFETDSNTISKEAALKEAFEVQDYEHPLGGWTASDGSVIPPLKKDSLPPEPLTPTPYDHDTPRPDKFDQEGLDSIEDEFNYPAAKSDAHPSVLNTDENMNENASTLFGGSNKLLENIDNNGNGSRSLPENDHDGQFNRQGNDIQLNNNKGDGGQLNHQGNDDLLNYQGNDIRLNNKGDGGQLNNQGNDDLLNDQGNDVQFNEQRKDDWINDQGNDGQFNQGNDGQSNHQDNDRQSNHQVNDGQFNHQYNDGQCNHQVNDDQFNHQDNDGHFNQSNDGQFNHEGNDLQFNHEGNVEQVNDTQNYGQLNTQNKNVKFNDKGNYCQVNDQGNNGQLNDQGHSRASDMGPVVSSEASLNDKEDFEDNEVRIVTIKGDPTFISKTLHRLVKKENQDVKLFPNENVSSKSHIPKAQGNQNTMDSQMSAKKISDENSSGGPSLIFSTLPGYSHTQINPASQMLTNRTNMS